MDLITPDFGLLFWQTITFLIVLFLLTKFAWKPILKGLKDREVKISQALEAAENAEQKMKEIESGNQKLLDEARQERDKVIAGAKESADRIIAEAGKKAEIESNKILEQNRKAFEAEKNAAVEGMKKQISLMSVQIAETLLRKELENKTQQEALVASLVKDLKLN